MSEDVKRSCNQDWSTVTATMDQKDGGAKKTALEKGQREVDSLAGELPEMTRRIDEVLRKWHEDGPKLEHAVTRGNDHHWSQSVGAMASLDNAWSSDAKSAVERSFLRLDSRISKIEAQVDTLVALILDRRIRGGGGDHNWSQETGEMETRDIAMIKSVEEFAKSGRRFRTEQLNVSRGQLNALEAFLGIR